MRAGRDLSEHAAYLEQIAKGRIVRGRLDITARLDEAAQHVPELDRRRAISALRELQTLRDELGLVGEVPLTMLTAVPELFRTGFSVDLDSARAALQSALQNALHSLEQMRVTEGGSLHEVLIEHLERVQLLTHEIDSLTQSYADRNRARLRERATRYIESLSVRVDRARLEQELVLLAMHGDILEELNRLSSHCGQFVSMLEQPAAVGRKLDFLLQEMAREVNTIGSKSTDVEIAFRVVELKSEIDRMREQVQNVE